MVEKNPWWNNVQGPFPTWQGPLGCKEDGGGCHRAQGKVGKMLVHQAVSNHDQDGALPGYSRKLTYLYFLHAHLTDDWSLLCCSYSSAG